MAHKYGKPTAMNHPDLVKTGHTVYHGIPRDDLTRPLNCIGVEFTTVLGVYSISPKHPEMFHDGYDGSMMLNVYYWVFFYKAIWDCTFPSKKPSSITTRHSDPLPHAAIPPKEQEVWN